MSSSTAVENATDVMPLSIIKEKTPIMETNIPVMEELEIDMGDYNYRHRNNFIKTHKVKMLDVLVEMKRLFPFDTRYSGKIYQQTRGLRFHPLYPYFRKKETYQNQGKWYNPPTWFREKLEKSIREHPDLKNRKIMIEKCMYIIKIWYDNEGKNTECGRMTWDWNEDRTSRRPMWSVRDLYNAFDNYREWKGEWLYVSYTSHNHQEEYNYTAKIRKELRKDPCEYRKWEEAMEYSTNKNTIYTDLRNAFTYRQSVRNLQLDEIGFKDVLTLKIKRIFCGDRMDYKNNFIGKYHMLRWKKTMANGNCSNKDLKATHLYYRDKEYEGEKRYGERGGWIFEAVKIDNAIACAEMNGFPKWGKKGNGKKKPTYREIKMWWYKLE